MLVTGLSRGRLSRLPRRLGLLLRLRLFSVTLEPDSRFGSSRGVLLLCLSLCPCLRMDSALRLRLGLRVRLLLFRLERSRDFFCFSWAALGSFADSASSGFLFTSGLLADGCVAGGRRSAISGGGSVKHSRLSHSGHCLCQYGYWISHSTQYPCVGRPLYFSS